MTTLTSLALLSFTASAAGADWPQWGGPARAFEAKDTVPLAPWAEAGPRRLWQRELGPGNSGVAVGHGLVITAFRSGDDEVLLASDQVTGEARWRHVSPTPLPDWFDAEFGRGPHATPLIVGGDVIFVGVTGRLSVLARDTGAVRWQVSLDGTHLERGHAASPLVLKDLVIVPVGGPGRALVAFRLADGAVVWSSGDDPATYASPTLLEVAGELQVVALGERALVGRDPRTGAELWRHSVDCELYALATTPLACPGERLVFVDRRGATLLRIERRGAAHFAATPLWSSRRLGSQVHNMVLAGEVVIGANESTTLCGLALADGAAVFRERTLADSNVLRCGASLVTLSTEGELVLSTLEPEGPRVRSRQRVLSGRVWAAPALVDGVLYARDDRQLVALELTGQRRAP